MDYATVTLLDEENAIEIIDQTKLPGTIELIRLKSAQEIWDAIYLLKVRGAPAIGVAAGFGIYLLAKEIESEDYEVFYDAFKKQKEYLNSSRPTAVNLSWALNRMEKVCIANRNKPVAEIKELLHKEAIEIQEEDIRVCKSIGEHGLTLVKPGDGILTHCNAGQLATTLFTDHYHIDARKMKMGDHLDFTFESRTIQLYREPSSSRAYPMKVEKKAEYYDRMFQEIGLK